ncbi:MAG: cation transporter [Alphaproteobacteria bacterium]
MSGACCHHEPGPAPGAPQGDADARYRRVLWLALLINGAMFAAELGVGLGADSKSLLADSIDFLSDAANYGISLFVLGLALVWRARAAFLKGAAMLVFGLAIAGATVEAALRGSLPHAESMGVIGALALAANLAVAVMLFRYRKGDSNRRAVWLCTRNDAIGNLAVMLAAAGVFASNTAWPDLAVAAIMSGLAILAGVQIMRQAWHEIVASRPSGGLEVKAG